MIFDSFSAVFYVDATTRETIQTDLESIVSSSTNVEPSVDACLQWLVTHPERNWLLLFDNADDEKLNLGNFFPPSRFGNILVTTRNRNVCRHTTKDAHEGVGEMNEEDATNLLLSRAQAVNTEENRALAVQIVKVLVP